MRICADRVSFKKSGDKKKKKKEFASPYDPPDLYTNSVARLPLLCLGVRNQDKKKKTRFCGASNQAARPHSTNQFSSSFHTRATEQWFACYAMN